MFKAYPSVTNRWSPSWEGLVAPGTAWLATVKYHGTNFSVHVRQGEPPAFARRKGLLKHDESHYGHESVMAKHDFTPLLSMFPDAAQVVVFGELYGGLYAHDAVPRNPAARCVQKGVSYSPDVHFRAFDVRVDNSDSAATSRFLDFSDVRAVCGRLGVPVVAVRFSGPRDDVVAWAKAHAADPVTPELPGLPAIDFNQGEGFVVRPAVEHRDPVTQDRVMLKIKNPRFDEIATCKSRNKVDPEKAAAAQRGADVACRYVTSCRAAAVCSKEAEKDLTMKNLKTLAGLLEKDAAADLARDDPEHVCLQDPTSPEAKAFRSCCFVVMKDFLTSSK